MKPIFLRPFFFALLFLCQSESWAAKSSDPKPKLLDIRLTNYDYPYPVSNLDLNLQDQRLQMSYMDVQPSEKSKHKKQRGVVVLLHGKNFNGAYWGTTIKALRESGYRVVVPDQIGFGKSSKPNHFQYSFHQLAQNTKHLLEALEIESAAILGHSMGGMLATRFALMYPDITEKLILVNPIGLEDYQALVPYQPVDWWYQQALNLDARSIQHYQRENYYDGEWKPAYDEWVDLLAGWTVNSQYPIIAWNSALTYDMIFTQPVVYEFSYVRSPTLLIIGTRDRTALGKGLVSEDVRETMGLYQELGKRTRDKIPEAHLVELDDVGHLPHVESFRGFINPLMAFLASDR